MTGLRALPMALLLVGLVALAGAACSDSDDDDDGLSLDEAIGSEPALEGPASRYAPFLGEMLAPSSVNDSETFAITPTLYATVGGFGSPNDGQALATEWGYLEGYRVLYDADGLIAGAADGNYYTTVEVHLFEGTEGAHLAFEWYDGLGETAPGSSLVEVERVGNETSGQLFREDGTTVVDGITQPETTLPGTEIPAVFHRVIFRRGNMVASVQTFGAVEFMAPLLAREIANIIDQRALGDRPAIEPTPMAQADSPAF